MNECFHSGLKEMKSIVEREVSIIIPLYTTSLNENEWFSLDRCFEVLGGNHEIVFVVPLNLSIDILSMRYADKFRVERFDNNYFKSIKGYNELMLSTIFYERFLYTKYVLIYQADCFIFKDDLEVWCNKGYDYIGAPWIKKIHYVKMWYRLYLKIVKIFSPKHSFEHLKLAVGNGGFSLRRTAKFYSLSIELKDKINFYLTQNSSSIYNEDVFWSLEAKKLKIAPYHEAIRFSFDDFPAVAYSLTNGQLPMGCHGWTKERCKEFWKTKIPQVPL